jgi:hypothetical protein
LPVHHQLTTFRRLYATNRTTEDGANDEAQGEREPEKEKKATQNAAAYNARERLLSQIRKQLPDNASAVIPLQQSELYETVSTRVFQDYSDNRERFKLLSKN